jgi:hypothetical protein
MGDPLAKTIVARFKGESEFRCDAAALVCHAVLLAAYALLCLDVLSPVWFVLIGLCAYVRNFNAIHEGSHARRGRNPLRRFKRLVMIVHSPLQLGCAEMARAHRLHHAYTGDADRDPHVAVNDETWHSAAVHACMAPEMSLVAHIQRERKISPALARGLVYNTVMIAALIGFGGVDFLWWIVATRLGSTAAWFIFDWILHRPQVFARTPAFVPDRLLALAWRIMFSGDNLNATRFHALHHRYAYVADSELPALARFMADQGLTLARSPGST